MKALHKVKHCSDRFRDLPAFRVGNGVEAFLKLSAMFLKLRNAYPLCLCRPGKISVLRLKLSDVRLLVSDRPLLSPALFGELIKLPLLEPDKLLTLLMLCFQLILSFQIF